MKYILVLFFSLATVGTVSAACGPWILMGQAINDVDARLDNVSVDYNGFPGQILIYGDTGGLNLKYKVYLDPDGKVQILGFRSVGGKPWAQLPARGFCVCNPYATCNFQEMLP